MKSFNLVRSLSTRVYNNYKGLLILCLSLATFGVESAWGDSNSKTYYARLTVKYSPTGSGTVYVGDNNQQTDDGSATSTGNNADVSFNISATAKEGYTFSKWQGDNGITFGSETKASTTAKFNTNSTNQSSPVSKTATANFVEGYSRAKAYAIDKAAVYVTVSSSTTWESIGNNWVSSGADQTSEAKQGKTYTYYYFAKPVEGYSLSGWSIISGGSVISGSAPDGDKRWVNNVTVTSTTSTSNNPQWFEYYPIVTAKTYTITLNGNGGSDGSATATYDGEWSDITHCFRTGYTLNGYYTAISGGNKVADALGNLQKSISEYTDANGKWIKDGAATLYAQYDVGYSNAIAKVSSAGGGKVYVTGDNVSYSETFGWQTEQDAAKRQDVKHTYYFFAKPNDGYALKGWSETDGGSIISGSEPGADKRWAKELTVTSTSSTSSNPQNFTYYAVFEAGAKTYYASAYAHSNPHDNTAGWCYISCNSGQPDDNWWTTNKKIDDNSTGKVETTASSGRVRADFYARALPGYKFDDWYTDAACTTKATGTRDFTNQNHYYEDITTSSTASPGTEINRYAHFVPVTVSAADAQTINFTAQTETKSATLTFPVENASSNGDFNAPTVGDGWSVSSWNYANNQVTVVVSFTATENTTTLGDHTATVTLTAKSGKSAIGQVTAHVAMTPALTNNVPSKKLVDDAAIDLNTLWTSTSNGTKTYTIKTWTPDGGAHNGGAVTPSITGSTLSLGDAGTLVLQLSQAAGTSSESKTAEHTLTINRRDNHISINGSQDSYETSCFMDGYAQITSLTATNTDYIGSPFSNVQTSGNDIATFYQNDMVIYSTYNLGPATWTISQPENYKYKAANATLTVNVVKEAEATNCYVLNDESEHKFSTGGLDFSGHFDTPLALNGPAYQLKFDAKKDWGGVNQFVAQYSIDGGKNWIDVDMPELSDSYKTFGPFDIPDNTTHIRFGAKTGATLTKYYKNVRVTRKTYLNASNVEITKTKSNNPIYVGASGENVGVGTLTINYSLANGGDLKVKWDNDKFAINDSISTKGINLGDKECSSLPIKYSSMVAGKDTANVVIYNNVYRTTATIIGTTIKRDQVIEWNTDIMIVGHTESSAASSNSIKGNVVTYESKNPEVIRVNNDANGQPTILEALQIGTADIIAFSAGNEEYNDASDTTQITVTDKDVQYIVWDQSLMGLRVGGDIVNLNAIASQPDSLKCSTTGQRLITYQSANESVVKIVNNNQLQIVGAGVTTVTATQAGGLDVDGHDFIAVTAEKKVVVRDPNAPCETYIYEQTSEVEFDLGWNAVNPQTRTKEIDFGGQEPRYVNFDYKGKSHNVLFEYYEGTLRVDQYINGEWSEVVDLGQPTKNGNYVNTGNIELNRYATKMRVRAESGRGYMYFKDCIVTLARYLEGSSLNTFETKVGSPVKQTLTVNYSNISGPLTFSLSGNSNFTIDKSSLDGVCGDKGSTTIEITYTPKAEAVDEEATLTLADGENKTYITLNGKASVTPLHIDWNIPDNNSCYTLDAIALSATALTDLNVEVPNFVWFSLTQNSTTGALSNNILTFDKAGTAIVMANTTGDPRYNPAQMISKTWTVNLTPTEIVTAPEIDGEVVYGDQLNDLALKAGVGAARNTVNQQPVEGTFAITSGDISTAGQHTVTVTFTPANTNMYASCTTTIPVTVQKAQPDATASAGEIVYGAKVESSELTNTGTTDGTWTWAEDEKDKVLAVGTHEGLKVHFTPTDQTNYNEIDGAVSLTITAATPILDWTAKAETAQVLETKTFTASSTNTDNTAAITYSITSGTDYATIDASTGEVTMLKAGTITIKASQAETTNYNAVNIETTCTISVAPTTIITAPTTDNIVSGTSLNEVILTGGEAQNTINSQAVAGTFAVTAGNLVNVGEQTLTITFTPTEGNKYAGCTTTITATIVPRTPTNEEIGTPSATDIVYGNAVKSSALSRDGGTLTGTWSWSDTRKDDILNAGTYDDLQVHFVPEDNNYNEADATVSLTIKKAAATLNWKTAPTEANVQDQLTYKATSNHSESAITYSITAGSDCATIHANTGALTITKAGTIAVQASQAATTNYEAAVLSRTTMLTGEFETVFTGDGDWNDPDNWMHGLPTSTNPDVVISGNMTIDESISVGSLTIEEGGSVTIIVEGDLTVNGKSKERDAYGDLFVHNGGNVTIGSEASVTVHDFVIEASIGTQNGNSQSGQVDNGDKVIYTNGAYIDINMDPTGHMVDAQWYGFTVPFPVDVQNGVARKEGDVFRKCTYGVEYMIAEYDMDQRKNTGKGWKYIKTGRLQPGHFYYFTANVPDYNVYSFKAADNTITIHNETQLAVNGEGPDANWNAVGNTTLTYATISGESLPEFVQTYVNGESRYIPVKTNEVQFVVGCPFFVQATASKPMVLSKPTEITSAHYAPHQIEDNSICVRIAEEGKRFSDQMYISASEDAQGQYQMGRDLAKAGVGTKSAQLWINAYNQQLCVNDAPLVANQAYYDMSLFIPKAGNYEISLPTTPTNGILYLTQDGYPIWNLNDAPFVLELGKGTISEYGLMFEATQASAPTDVQTLSENDNAQKILKEQSIYIYKNGNIFNVTGQKVK